EVQRVKRALVDRNRAADADAGRDLVHGEGERHPGGRAIVVGGGDRYRLRLLRSVGGGKRPGPGAVGVGRDRTHGGGQRHRVFSHVGKRAAVRRGLAFVDDDPWATHGKRGRQVLDADSYRRAGSKRAVVRGG